MAKDPVCGMDVSEKDSKKEVYEGKTYYFCSPGCQAEFRENPAKYVK